MNLAFFDKIVLGNGELGVFVARDGRSQVLHLINRNKFGGLKGGGLLQKKIFNYFLRRKHYHTRR